MIWNEFGQMEKKFKWMNYNSDRRFVGTQQRVTIVVFGSVLQ